MITGLIAEIGNHHFGDFHKALRLIREARDCGADYVKMQAIDGDEFRGSMPGEFYKQCDLGLVKYLECVAYAEDIGTKLFFSVFGSRYKELPRMLPHIPIYKIAASQFLSFSLDRLRAWNEQPLPVLASIPHCDDETLIERKDAVSDMTLMYASDYLEPPKFSVLLKYMNIFKRPIGYSDHNPGVDYAIQAVEMGCPVIEKHFNLYGQQWFGKQIYRDSLHAASAKEFERLAFVFKTREVKRAVSDLQTQGNRLAERRPIPAKA